MLADKTVTDLLVATEMVIRDLNRWEYVYPARADGCRYRDGRGAPSCLIGHVLYRWGVLDQVEEGGAELSLAYLGAADDVARVAQTIQQKQDGGETWGDALAAGINYIKRQEDAA